MPDSGRGAVRALVTAVTLLLAALLGVESAVAQIGPDSSRTTATAAAYTALPHEHSGTAEDDCNPRHGPRRSGGADAPTGIPGRAADRDVRTGTVHPSTVHAAREGAARGRSVDLPLLHRTFRC